MRYCCRFKKTIREPSCQATTIFHFWCHIIFCQLSKTFSIVQQMIPSNTLLFSATSASVLQLCHDGHLFSVARWILLSMLSKHLLKVFPSSHACNTLFYFFTMDIFSHTTSKHNGKAIWQRVIIFHSKMGQFCWFPRRDRQRQLFSDDNLELSGKAVPFKIKME